VRKGLGMGIRLDEMHLLADMAGKANGIAAG
jgi:hypothetical protein